MNNSPIDVLLQLPVPRVESAPAGSRARDESSEFDNHFRQASNPDAASPPPPVQPAANSAATTSERNSQTPAASSERSSPSTTSSPTQTPAEPATASESAAQSPESEEEAKSNADEHEEETAAVVAVALPVVEQVAAEVSADVAIEANTLPTEKAADAARVKSDADERPSAEETKPAARAARSDAHSESKTKTPVTPRAEATSDAVEVTAKEPTAKQQPAAIQPEPDATANQVKSTQVPTEANATDAAQPKTRREEKRAEQTAVDTPAAKQSPAQATTNPAQASKQSVVANKSNSEPIAETASRKSDKKIGPRASVAPTEAAAISTSRPAAIANNADTPTAPTVAQPQIPAANVAVATTNSAGKPQDVQSAPKNNFLSPFARLERGTHSTRGASSTGNSEAPRHVDPARFVSRVARAINTAQERGGPLQLRLSPPELGAMRLELTVNQGALTATIETENSTTRQLLLDNLPALRERLAEQSIKVERFDVDVRRDPSGNQQNTAPQDRGQAEHHDRRPGRTAAQRANAAAPAIEESAPIRRNISNTTINVVA